MRQASRGSSTPNGTWRKGRRLQCPRLRCTAATMRSGVRLRRSRPPSARRCHSSSTSALWKVPGISCRTRSQKPWPRRSWTCSARRNSPSRVWRIVGRHSRTPSMHLAPVDGLIIVIYGAFVLGIGIVLRRQIVDSADFFLAGRSIPAWVAGLAFLSANLGAQEVIGMAASGAKYGILTSHFYWVGAMPAMVFVGLFMMPFYYGSRAPSVPEYLKLPFDQKTRALNSITFSLMTIFSSG